MSPGPSICAGRDAWSGGHHPGANRSILLYVTGQMRTLHQNIPDLNKIFCEPSETNWNDGRQVVPLLHVWSNSSCNSTAAHAEGIDPWFAAGITDAKASDIPPLLVAADKAGLAAGSNLKTTKAYSAQLHHLYSLNRKAGILLRTAALSEAIVVRWRTDFVSTNVTSVQRFLQHCIHYLRNVEPQAVCAKPQWRGSTPGLPPHCTRRVRTALGDFTRSTCCTLPQQNLTSKLGSMLWDGMFVLQKRELDLMDGTLDRIAVHVGGGRSELRLWHTFVNEAGRPLVWPTPSALSPESGLGLYPPKCTATP